MEYLMPQSYFNDLKPFHFSSGAKDKQAIQRGAEQTSNSARRGTNTQLSEARNIQAIRGAAGQTSNCVFDEFQLSREEFSTLLDKSASFFFTTRLAALKAYTVTLCENTPGWECID